MKTDQLDYGLPSELIAQHPAAVRSDARLLVLDRSAGRLMDDRFARVGEYLHRGDCLVLNDTKVLPARFFARRRTGARLEGLFLGSPSPGLWRVLLKGIRKLKPNESILLRDRAGRDVCTVEVAERGKDGHCLLRVAGQAEAEAVLDRIGFPPLPPYIRRDDNVAEAERDQKRYQTVYATQPGAVAAPTAGLHFTEQLIAQLKGAGVRVACVTLHVGAGTFKPIATDEVEAHQIHSEAYQIEQKNADVINATREQGGRVIAVGTTVTRVLETVGQGGQVNAGRGTTDLFITPGYRFRIVEAMITNFHLPRSTLLALVAAFAGLESIKQAYQHAVGSRYRFYSYGDAMLIL
jgi:S-adenosylmethionine:tRNA ribosyltransferase-isomerase